MADKTAVAVRLATLGFHVFPLLRSGTHNEMKRPAVPEWQRFASNDPETVRRRWESQWWDSNPGIALQAHELVLDFDKAKGGIETLAFMEDALGLPRSYRVATPTGGMHVYFRLPPGVSVPNGVEPMEEFPGMDIRSFGGLVVGAGSVTPAGEYIELEGDLAKWN